MPRACLLLLALLALAGCGAAAAAHPLTDAQVAHRSGLALSDLPSGWTHDGEGQQADCPAFTRAHRTASAAVDSGGFAHDGDREQVDGSIFVFARSSSARSVFADLVSPATRRCYARRLGAALGLLPDTQLRGVTDAVTSVDPLGDAQTGARFAIAFTAGGADETFYIDILVVRSGRGIATELYAADGAPLDGGLRYDLTALTARRLAAALG